jgi:hypothetical protein
MPRLAVAAAVLVPALAAAQQQDLEKVEIKVHPVAGAVYMLEPMQPGLCANRGPANRA